MKRGKQETREQTELLRLVEVAREHGHRDVGPAIDNRVKGAAGQAVQCRNIATGLDEASGLADAPAAWAGATAP